eukprot:493958_1
MMCTCERWKVETNNNGQHCPQTDEWQCSSCTFIQSQENARCIVCQTQAPSIKNKECTNQVNQRANKHTADISNNWQCPACTFIQPDTHENCQLCQSPMHQKRCIEQKHEFKTYKSHVDTISNECDNVSEFVKSSVASRKALLTSLRTKHPQSRVIQSLVEDMEIMECQVSRLLTLMKTYQHTQTLNNIEFFVGIDIGTTVDDYLHVIDQHVNDDAEFEMIIKQFDVCNDANCTIFDKKGGLVYGLESTLGCLFSTKEPAQILNKYI